MTLTPDEFTAIGHAGPAFISMLRIQEEVVVGRMYGNFRNGQKDFLSDIAELACIRGLIHQVTTAMKRLEKPKES